MSTRIDVVEHSNFRSIIVSGAIGINGQNSIEITLFSNEMNCSDYAADPTLQTGQIKARRVIECKLLMEPIAAKSLQDVLNQTIANFEKAHGEIKKAENPDGEPKDETDTTVSTPYR
jgi:hypothetical protein